MISRREFLKAACIFGGGIVSGSFLTSCDAEAKKKKRVKEAYFYTQRGDNVVQCHLCPFECVLKDREVGHCRVRQNRGGKLYTLVYGKPVAIHIDPIEKKPFYHFLPGRQAFSIATVGCNLRCLFCQNWEISQATPNSVPFYNAPPSVVVKKTIQNKVPIIAYTYTEPIVFSEYMIDTSKIARKRGLKCVMVSAGFIRKKPLKTICSTLDGIKIDLKAFSDEFYRKLVGGRLKPVLEALLEIKKRGVWLEIVNLVIPGKNDSPKEIKKLALWVKKYLGKDVPVHFTRFIPMYKLRNVPPTPVKILTRCREIAMSCGLHYVYVGNVLGHPGSNTYCPKCGKPVIKREGYWVDASGISNGKCVYCHFSIAGVWK